MEINQRDRNGEASLPVSRLGNCEPVAAIRDDEIFERMTLSERLQHFILIVCFVILVLTGLPLLFYPSAGLRKMFFFETSFAWRGFLHRVAGTGLILVSVFH